jgi:hypothetical protein
VQRRRTGSTGFDGISGTPAEAGWWGGVLFVAAIVLGLAGPLLAVTGVVPATAPVAVQVCRLVIFVGRVTVGRQRGPDLGLRSRPG